MKAVRHLQGKFGRPRTLRRVLVPLLLLAILGAVGGFYHLTRPQRLARLAGALLTDLTGAKVHIDAARFGISSIEIRNVALRIPSLEGENGRLFKSEQVYIRHSLPALLRGEFQASAITFVRPTLYLTENAQDGTYNYQLLRQDKEQPSKDWSVEQLPALFIRDGSIEFGQSDGGVYSHLGRIRLEGRLTEQRDKPGSYHFSLRQQLDGTDNGPALDGRLDLRRLQLHAELQRFTLDSTGATPLPLKYRKWWQQLSPEGSLPTVRFGYDPDQGAGFYAELEVRDMQLTLPYTESVGRMSVATGRFTLNRERITITNLSGVIEGFDYVINGRIDGLEPEAPFTMTARLSGEIDPQPRFLPWFPAKLQKQFHRFDPSGPILATVRLVRPQPGHKLQYEGSVVLKGMNVRYQKFAYPLHEVTGQIRFNEQRVDVVDFKGRGPQGGAVVANGAIFPPGDGAAVEIDVEVTDLPVDDLLLDAMEPKHRKVVDVFRDVEMYQRLQERNVVQTTATRAQRQAQADALSRQIAATSDAAALAKLKSEQAALETLLKAPVFDLGGRINVKARVTRPFGPNERYSHVIDLDLLDVQPLMGEWPYPVRVRGGQVHVEKTFATASDVRLQSLNGEGKAIVNGKVLIDGDRGRDLKPDIDITAQDVPIDGVLLASLPSKPAQWLHDLKLSGKVDASAKVYRGDQGIDFKVDAALEDAAVEPGGGQLRIDQVAGRVSITRRHATLHEVIGRRHGGQIKLAGDITLDDQKAACDLRFGGENLAIEPQLLDLFPQGSRVGEAVRQQFQRYKPSGRLDAQVHYLDSGEGNASSQIELLPREVEFDFAGRRVALREMSGRVEVGGGKLTLHDCAASFDELGRLTLSGAAALRDEAPADLDLQFTAANTRFDELTRALLPQHVADTLTRLNFAGGYHLSQGRLQRSGGQLQFDGRIDLIQAALDVEVEVRELDGRLQVKAHRASEQADTQLELTLQASSLLANERLIRPLELHLRTDEQRLLIEQLRGGVYGGQLVASAVITPTAKGTAYELQATLNDAAMDPVVHPKRHPPYVDRAKPQHEDSGSISASLSLSGIDNDPGRRSGRGEISVRDARMYELPVAMAMLQIINLAPPTAKGFDRASASYLIDGDRVNFDRIRFESPTVAIAGEGQMRYSTRQLDLMLVTRNPGIQLGPLGDLVRMFKDELISVEVTGTLNQPQARLRSFNGVKETWDRIFGNGKRAEHNRRSSDAATAAAQAP